MKKKQRKYEKKITIKFFSNLKPFWALSRTPHGLLDMTMPAFSACICLGSFPCLYVVITGIITIFAGYTAIYALNDLVDLKTDTRRISYEEYESRTGTQDLDAAIIRHPLARQVITYKQGLLWTLFWGAVALSGAWMLNPFCIWFFIAGCVLEGFYCFLFPISPLRVLINGIVKTLGPLAAVWAVNPHPPFIFTTALFFMLFFWEIGGQNIPNDCADINEDKKLMAKTVAVIFGMDTASFASLASIKGASFLCFILFYLSPAVFDPVMYILLAAVELYLLIMPALRFHKIQDAENAMRLFNRASYFPPALFILFSAWTLIK